MSESYQWEENRGIPKTQQWIGLLEVQHCSTDGKRNIFKTGRRSFGWNLADTIFSCGWRNQQDTDSKSGLVLRAGCQICWPSKLEIGHITACSALLHYFWNMEYISNKTTCSQAVTTTKHRCPAAPIHGQTRGPEHWEERITASLLLLSSWRVYTNVLPSKHSSKVKHAWFTVEWFYKKKYFTCNFCCYK